MVNVPARPNGHADRMPTAAQVVRLLSGGKRYISKSHRYVSDGAAPISSVVLRNRFMNLSQKQK